MYTTKIYPKPTKKCQTRSLASINNRNEDQLLHNTTLHFIMLENWINYEKV